MEVLKEGHIALSDNGWTDNELGIRWLKECFEPETRPAPRKSRILIMDGHACHISTEALKFCIASNIIVLCLPSHSTHITQPLDVGIFRPLAMAYSKGVLERGEYSPIYSVDKLQFLEIYQYARQTAITNSNIASAWKKAGLSPFDLEIVLQQLPKLLLESTASITTPEPLSTPPRTTLQDLVNQYIQVPKTPSNTKEVEVLFHKLYSQGILNLANLQILKKLEKASSTAIAKSTI
jgi:DDE superfamily endonuclease